MGYLNNPRRIRGKVDIVYSDTDISSIESVDVTGNSNISHPYEVYQSNLTPSYKACTMDGCSKMDGTYQMIDENAILGWWGDELGDSDGIFSSPQILTIEFVTRPISSWILIGDNKLNQCPYNFTIEYLLNGVVLETKVFTKNTEVQLKVYTSLESVNTIRLAITQWNKPNACVKILKFFDMLSETYLEKDLASFEVNEEMGSSEGNYNLSSDTMTVFLYNKDRKFNVGYLKNLLILDRKVIPYIGIEDENGVVNYTQLGTFYSDEWKVEQDGQFIKCTAVDRLIRLQNKLYVGYPLNYEVTLYSIVEDVLIKAGFDSTKYVISKSLKDTIIPNAFMPKQSVWDALQTIANAGLCRVFVDRENKINVIADDDIKLSSDIEINPSNMFTYSSNISLTEFANRVAIEYCDVEISDDLVTAAETWVQLKKGEVIEITLEFSLDIAYATISINTENITLSNFQAGINACTVTLTNATNVQRQGTITVKGNAIDVTYKTLTVQDDDSVRDYGTFEYSHPSSELVQSSTQAKKMAQTLLAKMKAGEGVVTTVWRGSPNLELGKIYRCVDRYGDINNFECEYNKITFDGGMKQETRGRKITEG